MKMRRKGFLAAMLGLAAAPVLGKMPGRAKGKVPRYWAPTADAPPGLLGPCIYLVWDDSPGWAYGGVWSVSLPWSDLQPRMEIRERTAWGLVECAREVHAGHVEEITAKEAERIFTVTYAYCECERRAWTKRVRESMSEA